MAGDGGYENRQDSQVYTQEIGMEVGLGFKRGKFICFRELADWRREKEKNKVHFTDEKRELGVSVVSFFFLCFFLKKRERNRGLP